MKAGDRGVVNSPLIYLLAPEIVGSFSTARTLPKPRSRPLTI